MYFARSVMSYAPAAGAAAMQWPDWVKELLGMDEDVDVEARDCAASAAVASVGGVPPPLAQLQQLSQGESLVNSEARTLLASLRLFH